MLTVGCQRSVEPGAAGASPFVPSEAPTSSLALLPGAAPAASSKPQALPLDEDCSAGADFGAAPERLAAELSARCVAGFELLLPPQAVLSGDKVSFNLADTSRCVRVLVVADERAGRTTLRLAYGARDVSASDSLNRVTWLGKHGPLCLSEAGDYDVHVASDVSTSLHVYLWRAR